MRRVFATLATASLIVIAGCGRTYDYRIEKTVDNLRYDKRLNENLMPPAESGKFKENLIFLRPPKNLAQSQTFLMASEAGKFDVEQSFQEAGKRSLHVMARVKLPKSASKKATAAPATPRGEFNGDVLAVLNNTYKPAEELVISKFKPVEKKRANSALPGNEFKRYTFPWNDKTVQVYLFKKDIYDVALVFEYPTTDHSNLATKIDLCLESFAVGDRAKQKLSGTGAEEEGGGTTTLVF